MSWDQPHGRSPHFAGMGRGLVGRAPWGDGVHYPLCPGHLPLPERVTKPWGRREPGRSPTPPCLFYMRKPRHGMGTAKGPGTQPGPCSHPPFPLISRAAPRRWDPSRYRHHCRPGRDHGGRSPLSVGPSALSSLPSEPFKFRGGQVPPLRKTLQHPSARVPASTPSLSAPLLVFPVVEPAGQTL